MKTAPVDSVSVTRAWVREHRPDVLPQFDEIVSSEAKSNRIAEACMFVGAIFFEAGENESRAALSEEELLSAFLEHCLRLTRSCLEHVRTQLLRSDGGRDRKQLIGAVEDIDAALDLAEQKSDGRFAPRTSSAAVDRDARFASAVRAACDQHATKLCPCSLPSFLDDEHRAIYGTHCTAIVSEIQK